MADLLSEAFDHASVIVEQVSDDQLHNPTICGWDVASLLNHMVGGNRYFAASARGETPDRALFHEDSLGEDPAEAYRRTAKESMAAWSRPGAVDGALASGAPAAFLWGIQLIEVLGHGWDLAEATGQSRDIPEYLVEPALEIARNLPPEQIRSEAVFGPEREAPAGASAGDRFAAYLGRMPG